MIPGPLMKLRFVQQLFKDQRSGFQVVLNSSSLLVKMINFLISSIEDSGGVLEEDREEFQVS